MPPNATSFDRHNFSSPEPPARGRAQNPPGEASDSDLAARDASAVPRRNLSSHFLSKLSLLRPGTNLPHRAPAPSSSSSSSAHPASSDGTVTADPAPPTRPARIEEDGPEAIHVHKRQSSAGGGEKSAAPPPRPKTRLRARTGSLRKVALLGGTIRMRADKRAAEGEEGTELTPRASTVGERQISPGKSQESGIGAGGAAQGALNTPQTNAGQRAAPDARDNRNPAFPERPEIRNGDGSTDSGDDSDSRAQRPAESSTTDSDSAPRPSSSERDEPRKSSHPHAPDSYFPLMGPPAPHLPPPRRARSPLAGAGASTPSLVTTPPPSAIPAPTASASASDDADDDDAATARWGWALLLGTWIVFVSGVGSCLGVWSWAWDVGARPDAPPELADDETLPVVGYYPALAVLTAGVVSWVWVGVAWVGMKYFRHAKVVGEG